MASKPWLLYGQSKAQGKGSYKASSVLTHEGLIISAEDYFEDYKVYNNHEKAIKFDKDKNIEYYYPRIFSILLFGRDAEVQMKHLRKIVETSSSSTRRVNGKDAMMKWTSMRTRLEKSSILILRMNSKDAFQSVIGTVIFCS